MTIFLSGLSNSNSRGRARLWAYNIPGATLEQLSAQVQHYEDMQQREEQIL